MSRVVLFPLSTFRYPATVRSLQLIPVLLATFTLTACVHHPQMTVITTRQNGTVKICGKLDTSNDKFIKGVTPEGSKITISVSDVVTQDENGTCKGK